VVTEQTQQTPVVVGGRPTITLSGISKNYGAVAALTDVSIEVLPGEVHALLGENGAGKSTLMGVASGTTKPDTGTIEVLGEVVDELTPALASSLGIAIVHQHPAVLPDMTVAENILVAVPGEHLEFAGGATASMRRLLDDVGLTVHLEDRVDGLSLAQKHLLELAKALALRPKLLILDEPTAPLGQDSVDLLFDRVRSAARAGTAIVYITHRMAEVRELADRVTVLRDGRWAGTRETTGVSDDELVELMTGRTLDELFPDVPRNAGEVRLRLSEVTSKTLDDVSLDVRAGEIVALAGLVGSGKSEIGRACFGLEKLTGGRIEIDGAPLTAPTPRAAMDQGLVYYPADRHREGLVTTATLGENIVLSSLVAGTVNRFGIVSRPRRASRVQEVVQQLSIKPAQPSRRVLGFSGGNQQKALLARAFARDFAVHVFDEPTVGIDVGAKLDVYQHIKRLCASGAAVLLISSDMEEVIGLAHRVYAVREGRVVADLRGRDVTEHNIVRAFFDSIPAGATPSPVSAGSTS
jgi:ribose transport system ATP-binding protein